MVTAARLTAGANRTIDPLVLMQRVTDGTLDLIEAANGVMVGLADEDGVTYMCGAGNQVSYLGTRVDLDSSLSGLAVRTGQVQRSDNTGIDPRVDVEACRRLSVASLLCVPLIRRDETLGVLAVNATRTDAFTDDDVATLTRLADFVSVVIGSAHDLSRVQAQLFEMGHPTEFSTEGRVERDSAETASRYVMSVLSPDTVTRMDTSRRIQAFLDDPDRLSMVFQPIVDLVTDQVAAVEALARFDSDPYRAPDVWFDEAHQSGLGIELEMLATARAVAQLPMLPGDATLTINIGPQAAMSAQLLETIRDVPPQRLILELTEHSIVDDYPGLTESLRKLRQRGIRIAVDDAGSGYSNLAHILKLAPDLIKLDRDLVSGIDVDPVRRALATSLVAFAADTGAQIVAEGVESEDELGTLRRLGVRYAQGYHLGRPAAAIAACHEAATGTATR